MLSFASYQNRKTFFISVVAFNRKKMECSFFKTFSVLCHNRVENGKASLLYLYATEKVECFFFKGLCTPCHNLVEDGKAIRTI